MNAPFDKSGLPTPRTDALAVKGYRQEAGGLRPNVMMEIIEDVAAVRQLERELAEERGLREHAQEGNAVWAKRRDEALDRAEQAEALIRALNASSAELPLMADEDVMLSLARAKDQAYLERNYLVAALARLFPSGIRKTSIEAWSEDWHNCVYIDLPSGQISYHYHDSQAFLFEGLPPYEKHYDGHDKNKVHYRLLAVSSSELRIPEIGEGRAATTYSPTLDGPAPASHERRSLSDFVHASPEERERIGADVIEGATARQNAPRVSGIGIIKTMRDQRDELAEALRGTLNWLTSYPGGGALKAYDRARAILDRVPTHEQQLRNVAAGIGMTYEELVAALAAHSATRTSEGYYLASFKDGRSSGGTIVWWGPDRSGYTPYLEQAGVYSTEEAGDIASEHTVPVPVAFAAAHASRMVDTGHAYNKCFWTPDSLREAINHGNDGTEKR